MERQIKSETIYDGRVVKLLKDEVELDDGTRSIREVVKHHGGAAIALKRKDGCFYFVSQYRYAQETEMLEMCAGKLNEGEDPKAAIIRECEEELGFTINNLTDLGYMVPTCGYSSEKIYLFYGEEGEYVGKHFDEDERLDIEVFSIEKIDEMIKEGTLTDAKTICILYKMRLEGLL